MKTVTVAVPAVATLAAGTVAVSWVAETNVVVRAVPFQLTLEVDTNLVPLTVSVNWALPAVTQVGLSDVVVGTGLLIVNVTAFDVPAFAPEAVKTVTEAVPALATLAAGTVAVSWVEETNVVVSAVPFQLTFELLTKFVPLTVSVN